jgi:hypothetical protein
LGILGVLVRVTQDEIEALLEDIAKWKSGWYLSPLRLIRAEKNLVEKSKEGNVYSAS